MLLAVLQLKLGLFLSVPEFCLLQLMLQLKSEIVESPLKETIPKYRDDADLQNLIDWVQADWASHYSFQLKLNYICMRKMEF